MSGNDLKNINGDRIRVCTPEDGIPAHVTKFGNYRDNIEDAREVYLKDKERFFQIGLADRKIEMCSRDWADSAKVLFRCAIGLFRTVGATDDDRKYSDPGRVYLSPVLFVSAKTHTAGRTGPGLAGADQPGNGYAGRGAGL